MTEGLGVNETSVFTDMQGEVRHKGTVREEGDKEDGIRDDP
jgi:hypothetical protein